MAKNIPNYDYEIDLIELIKVFLSHKEKFILLGLIGLILGLAYTYQHKQFYETKFKIVIGHPIYKETQLIKSTSIQQLINMSDLNKDKFPNYSFNEKIKVFNVVTVKGDVPNMVTETFENALKKEVVKYKQSAQELEGFDTNQIILRGTSGLLFNNQDIAKLNYDQVLSSFSLSFGKTRAIYPNPSKHGVIGLLIGLVLALCWMITLILIRHLKLKK